MKVLILSCSTGEGHNSAANALYNELVSQKIEVIKADFLSIGKHQEHQDFFSNCLNIVTKKTPKVFGMLYQAGATYSATKIISPIYLINSLHSNKLEKYIKDNNFDVVISTHLYAMECIAYLKKHHKLSIKCYGVLTDYTCIPFLEETIQDGYFVPHKLLIPELLKHGINKEKIIPTGIPIDRKFKINISKDEARFKLNLNSNEKIIMIMTGGIGCGNVSKLCEILLKNYQDTYHIMAMVGKNKELENELKNKFPKQNISVISFTPLINYYMAASDVLITKPGGISITEAAVINIPMIFSMAIPGCETQNALFFENLGMSFNATTDEKLIKYINILFNNEEERKKMIQNQKLVINRNSTTDIIKIIIEND